MTVLTFPAPVTTPTPPPGGWLNVRQLDTVVRAVAADRSQWLPLVTFGTRERRWWTRLRSDDVVDVWLLTWLPGHTTDLHDHGGSAAAFIVTQGRLEEVRPGRDGRLTSTVHGGGRTSWVPPRTVHDVRAHHEPAVSIHAYSPPLTRMTYYEPAPDGRLVATRTVNRNEPEEHERS